MLKRKCVKETFLCGVTSRSISISEKIFILTTSFPSLRGTVSFRGYETPLTNQSQPCVFYHPTNFWWPHAPLFRVLGWPQQSPCLQRASVYRSKHQVNTENLCRLIWKVSCLWRWKFWRLSIWFVHSSQRRSDADVYR